MAAAPRARRATELGSGTVMGRPGLDSIAGRFTTQDAVQFFVANLGANAFQFSSVQAVEYRFDGNCSDFWELLGGSSCEVTSRAQWLASVEPNR